MAARTDLLRSGPAKDYLRSLQDRLQETEALLLGALNRLPDDEVLSTLQQEKPASHQTWTASMSGQEYWNRYPLTGLESVRQWQRSRNSETASSRPQEQPSKSVIAGPKEQRAPQNIKMQSIDSAPSVADFPSGDTRAAPDTSGSPGYTWPQAPVNALAAQDERYSEETRDVAQTLFSISNQGQTLPREHPQSVPKQTQDDVAISTDLDTLPSRFPKHLFW